MAVLEQNCLKRHEVGHDVGKFEVVLICDVSSKRIVKRWYGCVVIKISAVFIIVMALAAEVPNPRFRTLD